MSTAGDPSRSTAGAVEPGQRGPAPDQRPLVICSKSRWRPSIRREHALASLAAVHGHPVTFVEAPVDVRELIGGDASAWLAGLGAARVASQTPPAVAAARAHVSAVPAVRVVARSTLAPAHRHRAAELIDTHLLARSLRRHVGDGAAVVATTPWQWPALARLEGVRRVFDCADDWSKLVLARGAALRELYRRIAGEADAIVVDAPALAALFPSRRAVVVRNATSAALLSSPLSASPRAGVLAYAGTLSERFDVELVDELLARLPDWRLDVYGECRYSGRGPEPAPELSRLLTSRADRMRWHGPVERGALAQHLDRADVLILPHRRVGAITGDAMKLYDYAARGRPIISTRWSDELRPGGPLHLWLADDVEGWVAALTEAAAEPASNARDRRAWAERNSWDQRWSAWAESLFGGSGERRISAATNDDRGSGG